MPTPEIVAYRGFILFPSVVLPGNWTFKGGIYPTLDEAKSAVDEDIDRLHSENGQVLGFNSHLHAPAHMPQSGTGVAVCDCGATARVSAGKILDGWHTCPVCTHAYGLVAETAKQVDRIERLYAQRSECLARVNDYAASAESRIASRRGLQEIELKLREIRKETSAALAEAEGRA